MMDVAKRSGVLASMWLACLGNVAWAVNEAAHQAIQFTEVFVSGQDGYHTYRIPALITTNSGAVLAFCEGRKNGRGDSGDIDMLVKRSDDHGQSWSAASVIWDDEENTCGNACPVIDQRTGHIHLLMTWNRGDDGGQALHDGTSIGTRRAFHCLSKDDGHSWSQPIEITDQVKDPNWWWYATGPGVGIQLTHAPYQGRLVIPCDHTAAEYYNGSHVIYSDDAGVTWQRSGPIKPTCNECQVVELSDGRLMINMRSQEHRPAGRPRNGYRSIAQSDDGGETWSEPEFDPHLGDPVCQASLIRYDENCLLFSGPNPPVSPRRGDRARMTIRRSFDDGLTWPAEKLIDPGPSAYSCLTRLANDDVGLLYEADQKIVLATLAVETIKGD